MVIGYQRMLALFSWGLLATFVGTAHAASRQQELRRDLPHKDFMIMDLYERSEDTRTRLLQFAEEIATSLTSSAVVVPELKCSLRAEEKVDAELNGDWENISDIVRGSIAFNTLSDLHEGVKKFSEGPFEVVEIRDRFKKPLESGYRDMMLIFHDPENDVVGEIQFHLCHILKAKDIGHLYYEEMRKLKARASYEKRNLTIEEKAQTDKLMRASRFLYNRAMISSFFKNPCT